MWGLWHLISPRPHHSQPFYRTRQSSDFANYLTIFPFPPHILRLSKVSNSVSIWMDICSTPWHHSYLTSFSLLLFHTPFRIIHGVTGPYYPLNSPPPKLKNFKILSSKPEFLNVFLLKDSFESLMKPPDLRIMSLNA